MHAGALKALEFDRIVEAVCRLAVTPLGEVRLRGLRPLTDVRAVATALAATSEGVSYRGEHGSFPLDAPDHLDTILTTLAIEGRALDSASLGHFARFLASLDATRAEIRKTDQKFPILRGVVDAASSFEREAGDIAKKIDPSGQVVDEASPELKMIRDRLRKQRARLRGTLESFLRNKDTAKYLQDQVVTDRSGRYVLVVRAEHRAAIPGIVHGSSSSGASLFLEPLSTVEINNEVVALEQQEAEEVQRILLGLTDAFRRRAGELTKTIEAAVELDLIQARARFSGLCDGVEPAISSDGRLELRAARHPLLIRAVRELLEKGSGAGSGDGSGSEETPDAVPVDILLIPPTQVLVVTGPNTGGKTVALKTAGLLALMAQAGLHVPAAGGSQVTAFRSVFADIGDEQSIAASLSTFSWHMTNIAAMDRLLATPALVLLDEVGAGTDPVEGGALGVAIVDHFRQRRALVVATTHYDALKTYTAATEGVACAAFGFDPQTYAPTYRLIYGSPGRSLALEVAGRLGVPASIIESARAQRGAREAQLADHLAKMERDLNALDHERRLVARERETLAEDGARLQAREGDLRHREESFKRRADDRLDAHLREARREIDGIVDALKEKTAALAEEAVRRAHAAGSVLSTGETGAVRAAARAALDAVEQRHRDGGAAHEDRTAEATATVETSSAPPSVGSRVLVGGLGLEGIVRALHDRDAEVEVRGKRLRARVDELRVVVGPAPAPRPQVSVNVQIQPRETLATDLNVIGCTVDEAVTRVEKFLDEALLAEQRTVRIIHGYGTGQLRRGVAEFLGRHPLVAGFALAPDDQGGGGVTVVELKE
jgi:DNA mismatch repair protein MutS2